MAYNQTLMIPAHPNIYNYSNERNYRIEYSIPVNGTSEDTGILLLVPGFGGNIDSKIYKKMRDLLADKYNLIVVQCHYFGSDFMQESDSISFSLAQLEGKLSKSDWESIQINSNKLFEVIPNYSINFICKAILNETENEFNDMSYMQAIDNITAIEAVKIILIENQLKFNEHKVLGYGHSQGAYILHLMNKLAPHLFTYVIDNSAWVSPVYLHENRMLFKGIGKATVSIEFEYKAKSYISNKKSLSLHNLYNNFENKAYIYSVLGVTDNLVDVQDKKSVFNNMKYVDFELIDSKRVDGEIFKSTNHGLNADYLKMFDYVIEKLPLHKNKFKSPLKYVVSSLQTEIFADFSNALPLFQFKN